MGQQTPSNGATIPFVGGGTSAPTNISSLLFCHPTESGEVSGGGSLASGSRQMSPSERLFGEEDDDSYYSGDRVSHLVINGGDGEPEDLSLVYVYSPVITTN